MLCKNIFYFKATDYFINNKQYFLVSLLLSEIKYQSFKKMSLSNIKYNLGQMLSYLSKFY